MGMRFFDTVNRELELELPEFEHFDDHLDYVLGQIYKWSEDLYEEEYYVAKRWLEVREENNFYESVLHIFNPNGEYMISIDGNIQKGAWRFLAENNTFITEILGKNELYDLAFLNQDFFILMKHGDQHRKGQRKYFVMGREGVVAGLTWREVVEMLFNLYRDNSQFMRLIFGAVVVAGIIIAFSMR
jgi:hypothetical protein